LLVVIAIIGVLIALLLPAIQSARESARRSACKNNLRQVGLAIQLHHDARGSFPAARIGTRLHPDGSDQYATSWSFALLPYLEQQAIYDAFDPSARVDAAANAAAMRTPVAVFFCPTQRAPVADRDFDDNEQPSRVRGVGAAGDYAANSGTSTRHGMPGRDRFDASEFGPIYTRSRVAARQVTDGLSVTYAIGEKFVPNLRGNVAEGREHLELGDVAFFTGDARHSVVRRSSAGLPRGGDDSYRGKFGSLHAGISHFAFLDGSVRTIEHDIATETLTQLSAIGDGGQIPEGVFED
jgi:type II secretory pathway pseudopilin PulG